jgi:hypothetical protein
MLVERVKSGFLIAPDFKVTDYDRKASPLAGAYGGWLTDRTCLGGAGGYWLADRSRNRNLGYGGLVLGWFMGADRAVGFGAKGLIGGGRATLTSDVTILQPQLRGQPRVPVTTTVRFRDDFFVAEPEADVLVHLSEHFKLTGGVGYRFINGARRADERIRGVTGSVALQIGGGS